MARITAIESVADILRRFEHAYQDTFERLPVQEKERDSAEMARADAPSPLDPGNRRLGTVTVGRKTPMDGKLEIDAEMARVIGAFGYDVMYVVRNEAGGETISGLAKLSALACTCGQTSAGAAHTHHFLGSQPFKALTPGLTLSLELDAAGFVRLEPTGT